jgi:hypothetical protein
MKLLKTIGKIVALPLDLVLTASKLLLTPFVAISKLLHGEFSEWSKKFKFLLNAIREMFKSLKNGTDYTFSLDITYIDSNKKVFTRTERIDLLEDTINHVVNYYETNTKQKSA